MIGLDSDPALLTAARNTIGALTNAWHGDNAPATFYAAAARVGYDPAAIMANLHAEAPTHSYGNMAVHHYGRRRRERQRHDLGPGRDAAAVVPERHQGLPGLAGQHQRQIRRPAWRKGISWSPAARRPTRLQYVRAVSQSGGDFTFTNPWRGAVEVYRDGHHAGTVSGRRITLATSRHDTLELAPAGTSLSTIRRELSRPLQVGTSSSFGSGFEPADPPLSWTDTVDTAGGGVSGVTGICCGVTGPQAGIRTGETARNPNRRPDVLRLRAGGSAAYAHLMVYDLSGQPAADHRRQGPELLDLSTERRHHTLGARRIRQQYVRRGRTDIHRRQRPGSGRPVRAPGARHLEPRHGRSGRYQRRQADQPDPGRLRPAELHRRATADYLDDLTIG